ncbi:MAG: DUF4271 domain-containing protein [Vicingaceae bacterium]
MRTVALLFLDNLESLNAFRIPFWPFLLTMALATAILYTRATAPNHWRLVVRSVLSPRAVQQLIREENIMENTYSGLLVLTFFLSAALFIDVLNDEYLLTQSPYPFLSYAIFLTGILLIYVIKIAGLWLIQWIFLERALFEEYLVSLMNINVVLGASLIPLNLLILYSITSSASAFIQIGLVLVGLSFVLRAVRIIDTGRKHEFTWYNIILYLCTLEIVPIIMLIKLLENFGISLIEH